MGDFRCLAVAAGLLLVAGCATRWQKPGATAQEFGAMEASCTSRAYSRIPPSMQQVQVGSGYFTPLQTRCFGFGYSTRCFETGSQYIPPAFMMVDNNADARSADIQACFYENGWNPVKSRF